MHSSNTSTPSKVTRAGVSSDKGASKKRELRVFVKWSSLPTRAAAELMLAEHVRALLVPACARVGIACEFWGWRRDLDLHSGQYGEQRDGRENGGGGGTSSAAVGSTSAAATAMKGDAKKEKDKQNDGTLNWPVCLTLIFAQKTGRLLDDIENSLVGLDEDSACFFVVNFRIFYFKQVTISQLRADNL